MAELKWKYVTGPQHLHPIQLRDYLEDEKDYDLRFPKRNIKLLEEL